MWIIDGVRAFLRHWFGCGCFTFDQPILVRDGSAWLEISPGGYVQWLMPDGEVFDA